jgi:chromosome segregation ATPase
MLDRYEREWDEIMRAKREHEMELETLRRTNAGLMVKVKKLEEQNEELNREYVRIASSEVGLKVQNDQLADENEVLKAKVEGLKEIVDKQPQEIELRFKEEMDKLMTRTLEVHTENQNLEESMLEMEKDLVGTKMQLATVNEDYDLLKNRWNDLRKALGD